MYFSEVLRITGMLAVSFAIITTVVEMKKQK